MRRVNGTGTEKIGGAWQCAAAVTPTAGASMRGASVATRKVWTKDKNETLCAEAGCKNGACIVGIVLQQS
jgi:hypothetical protein